MPCPHTERSNLTLRTTCGSGPSVPARCPRGKIGVQPVGHLETSFGPVELVLGFESLAYDKVKLLLCLLRRKPRQLKAGHKKGALVDLDVTSLVRGNLTEKILDALLLTLGLSARGDHLALHGNTRFSRCSDLDAPREDRAVISQACNLELRHPVELHMTQRVVAESAHDLVLQIIQSCRINLEGFLADVNVALLQLSYARRH